MRSRLFLTADGVRLNLAYNRAWHLRPNPDAFGIIKSSDSCEIMLYEFLSGWLSWVGICTLGIWLTAHGLDFGSVLGFVLGKAARKMEREIDLSAQVFVLSMSLCLGAVALLCASYNEVAESQESALLPIHPWVLFIAPIAIFLGVRSVPRWGDRLSKK